jgi:hypothetical protein
MVLTFRTAMLSEGEEVVRVIRAAFTSYVRALGREFPADGSAQFAEERERFAAELERGDVYVALDGERIVGAVRTKPQEVTCLMQAAMRSFQSMPFSGSS